MQRGRHWTRPQQTTIGLVTLTVTALIGLVGYLQLRGTVTPKRRWA